MSAVDESQPWTREELEKLTPKALAVIIQPTYTAPPKWPSGRTPPSRVMVEQIIQQGLRRSLAQITGTETPNKDSGSANKLQGVEEKEANGTLVPDKLARVLDEENVGLPVPEMRIIAHIPSGASATLPVPSEVEDVPEASTFADSAHDLDPPDMPLGSVHSPDASHDLGDAVEEAEEQIVQQGQSHEPVLLGPLVTSTTPARIRNIPVDWFDLRKRGSTGKPCSTWRVYVQVDVQQHEDGTWSASGNALLKAVQMSKSPIQGPAEISWLPDGPDFDGPKVLLAAAPKGTVEIETDSDMELILHGEKKAVYLAVDSRAITSRSGKRARSPDSESSEEESDSGSDDSEVEKSKKKTGQGQSAKRPKSGFVKPKTQEARRRKGLDIIKMGDRLRVLFREMNTNQNGDYAFYVTSKNAALCNTDIVRLYTIGARFAEYWQGKYARELSVDSPQWSHELYRGTRKITYNMIYQSMGDGDTNKGTAGTLGKNMRFVYSFAHTFGRAGIHANPAAVALLEDYGKMGLIKFLAALRKIEKDSDIDVICPSEHVFPQ